ncbi:MAG: SprT-like domain-containing protein [Planctomycetes bacterium]|nr:SprT-like domain-containing protein [Planctomycetota bacterium]
MEISQARDLAIDLMDRHGLTEGGWRFRFIRSRRILGQCRKERREICLSVFFTALNDEGRIEQTILHEIAHALAGCENGHGPAWKTQAVRLGVRPRSVARNVRMPQGRYKAHCPKCGDVGFAHRRPKYLGQAQYKCKICRSTITWLVRVESGNASG